MIEDRTLTKIRKLFIQDKVSNQIFTSSTDIGVRRNQGRNGARFAPNVILEQFKNMTFHESNLFFTQIEVANRENEETEFDNSQAVESKSITQNLNEKNSLHLGGGHDHIFPLLKSLETKFHKIVVINIDAHCDTRIDEQSHSGNPFRKFDLLKKSETEFNLIHFGIHPYANSPLTLSPLKYSSMKVIMDIQNTKTLFEELEKLDLKNSALVLSLDADGLNSSIMKAVSAVNHNGISAQVMSEVFNHFKKSESLYKCFGIYEYNPLYEDLSLAGARYLAQLVFQYYF